MPEVVGVPEDTGTEVDATDLGVEEAGVLMLCVDEGSTVVAEVIDVVESVSWLFPWRK